MRCLAVLAALLGTACNADGIVDAAGDLAAPGVFDMTVDPAPDARAAADLRSEPGCFDGTRNMGESDVDCGGPCMPCALGQQCSGPGDCLSGSCDAGRCSGWEPIGPPGGSITALATDPRSALVAYAGTSIGVYKTVDGGRFWRLQSDGFPQPYSFVNSLVIDPSQPDTLYAAFSSGVLKSSDGGAHWRRADAGLAGFPVSPVVLSAARPTTLFAANWQGLHRSTDGGSWWSRLGGATAGRIVRDVAVDPRNPTLVYAVVAAGPRPDFGAGPDADVLKSSDGGDSWTSIAAGTFGEVYTIHVAPPDGAALYLVASRDVFRSDDRGASWSRLPPPPDASHTGVLAIDPANPASLLLGENGWVAVSSDGGASWKYLPGMPGSSVHALAFDASGGYFAGDEIGLYRREHGASEWSLAARGIQLLDVPALAVDPRDEKVLYAGVARAGVFASRDGGATWKLANGTYPNGIDYPAVHSLAIHPQNSAVLYAGSAWGLYRSDDTAATWRRELSLSVDAYPTAIVFDPRRPAIAWSALWSGGLFRTGGNGTWLQMMSDGEPVPAYCVVVDPTDSDTVWAGGYGGLVKTTDGGASWSRPDFQIHPDWVYALGVTHAGPGPATLYAGTSTLGMWKSLDGGSTWSRLAGSPAAGQLAIDPTVPSVLYMAGSKVYASEDAGLTWNPRSSDIEAKSIAVARSRPSTIYVGTLHSGAFRSITAGK